MVKVAGFAGKAPISQGLVVKNFNERIESSAKIRDDCIKKVANYLSKGGYSLETAMNFLDDDGSRSISREELAAGFKTMGVIIPQAQLKNLFVILDKDGDNEIGMDEFETVFGKYLTHGRKVQQISEAQMNLEFKEIEDAERLGTSKSKTGGLDG